MGYFKATINAKSGLFLQVRTPSSANIKQTNSRDWVTEEHLSLYVAKASTDLCAAADPDTWTRVLKEQQQHWRRSRFCSAVLLLANQKRRFFAWSMIHALWLAKGQKTVAHHSYTMCTIQQTHTSNSYILYKTNRKYVSHGL